LFITIRGDILNLKLVHVYVAIHFQKDNTYNYNNHSAENQKTSTLTFIIINLPYLIPGLNQAFVAQYIINLIKYIKK